MDEIEQLRAAGFSDEEIEAFITEMLGDEQAMLMQGQPADGTAVAGGPPRGPTPAGPEFDPGAPSVAQQASMLLPLALGTLPLAAAGGAMAMGTGARGLMSNALPGARAAARPGGLVRGLMRKGLGPLGSGIAGGYLYDRLFGR